LRQLTKGILKAERSYTLDDLGQIGCEASLRPIVDYMDGVESTRQKSGHIMRWAIIRNVGNDDLQVAVISPPLTKVGWSAFTS
jgi:hypothetical protein